MLKNKRFKSNPVWFPLLILAGVSLLVVVLLKGTNIEVLNPKGYIAHEQNKLLLGTVLLLLEIAIPTLTYFYYTAWKYRETNKKAVHIPRPQQSKTTVFTIWALPTITMILLAILMWPSTHRLAPQRALQSGVRPITIQVVALRWKWLFIYPEQEIATTNFVQLPVNTPVQFDITADEAPMSSFWIPQLAGQLYAMTGHVNRLNIMAETVGDYPGSNAEINGAGFAGMKFTARASSVDDFNKWVQEVKTSSVHALDDTQYKKLLTPSENNKAAFYSPAQADVYNAMLIKYSGSHSSHTEHK